MYFLITCCDKKSNKICLLSSKTSFKVEWNDVEVYKKDVNKS